MQQVFWERSVLCVSVVCVCREYSTSRGRPPCQRASWTERPSCRGGGGKKETSKFKNESSDSRETAGRRPGTLSGNRGTIKRLNSCFRHVVKRQSGKCCCSHTHLIFFHTQCILTVRSNRPENIGSSQREFKKEYSLNSPTVYFI